MRLSYFTLLSQQPFRTARTVCTFSFGNIHRNSRNLCTVGSSKPDLSDRHNGKETPKLLNQIRARITATGPITVASYMREVLANPQSGYYMNKDVFGTQGDFITSPEISQVFGELVGIWMLNEWRRVGSPRPLQLVEFGPGRGTLMADILRVFGKLEKSLDGISVHLIEMSPFLSNVQELKLCGSSADANHVVSKSLETSPDLPHYKASSTLQGLPVYWHHHLPDVPDNYSSYVAHEFFDALPVHQLVRTKEGWREVLVDLDPQNQLRFFLSRHRTPVCSFAPVDDTREKVEVSTESLNLVQQLCQRLESDGGSALLVDYGHFGDKGHTFRAFRKHALHDPLKDPGFCDLTADVDFRQFERACQQSSAPCITFGPVIQRDFLFRMGLRERVRALLGNPAVDEKAKELLQSAVTMLTDPQQMGERFKFFAIFPEVLRPFLKRLRPAGFAEN